jgi:hypothetical protein
MDKSKKPVYLADFVDPRLASPDLSILDGPLPRRREE